MMKTNRIKKKGVIIKIAKVKPLASGRAGGTGSHPAQVDVMAKPVFFLLLVFCQALEIKNNWSDYAPRTRISRGIAGGIVTPTRYADGASSPITEHEN